MKLFMKNSLGYSKELFVKSQTIHLSTFFNYLQLTTTEQTLQEVIINDRIFPCQKNEEGHYIIPCYMSRENHTTIQLLIDQKMTRLVIKYTEELYVGDSLIDSFADFHHSVEKWLQGEKKSIDDLIEAIKGGDINLLQIINPLTGFDDESLLEDIYNVLPLALDICTKPRQHLRMEEEILDVELVKQITPSSLQHLASHSEHWRSRTITGLIPSRLRAEIYEDDINIYENIFFKMVIQAIGNYVEKKHAEVKNAIMQKDTLHDWEFYAAEINDYHKLEMLQSLLPEYDSETEKGIQKQFQEIRDRIITIEKQLSSIFSTPFFQSIDATKRLALPIQPTNIINMDNRYHELFKVWNKLLFLNNKPQEEVTGASIVNVDEYYQAYVQVLSIYSLHLLGYEFHENSVVEMKGEHTIHFSFSFHNNYCVISAQNQQKGLDNHVRFKIEESLLYEVYVPESFPVSFKEYEEELVFKEIWKDNQQILVFRKKPSISLEKKLSQVVKKYMDEYKGITKDKKINLKKLDVQWRKVLSEELAKMTINRTFELNVHSLFRHLGGSESSLQKYTDYILETNPSSDQEAHIYMLPFDLQDFSKVENFSLLQRLVNFGEALTEVDSPKYGNYRSGILPISQTDLRSIQRLSKLFNLFIYRQLIYWKKELTECPACKSSKISKTDQHSWKCLEANCQMTWGITKCASGCQEYYEWMKPIIKPKSIKYPKPNVEGNQLEMILLNEMLFDRSVITAFDFQINKANEFIYQPRCPKCGKSSLK